MQRLSWDTVIGFCHYENGLPGNWPLYSHHSENDSTKKMLYMDVQVYKRLQEIDAYGAEARAATILAGLSFDNSMQVVAFT